MKKAASASQEKIARLNGRRFGANVSSENDPLIQFRESFWLEMTV